LESGRISARGGSNLWVESIGLSGLGDFACVGDDLLISRVDVGEVIQVDL
jgi:hypothetical protein